MKIFEENNQNMPAKSDFCRTFAGELKIEYMAKKKISTEEFEAMWKAYKEADKRLRDEPDNLSTEENAKIDVLIKSGFADRICEG